MNYRIVKVDEKNKTCEIEYCGKIYFVRYDYYMGRFYCRDNENNKYFFPDIADGMIARVLKYKTFSEQINSREFMIAFTTEMARTV